MKKWFVPLLCALPIVGVVLWYVVGKNPGNLATLGLVLACPLAHMFLMKHDHGNHSDKEVKKI